LDARHRNRFRRHQRSPRRRCSPRHPLPGAVLAPAADVSDTHVGAVLQQQVGQHWQPLGFFSKKFSKLEVNYFTFDRELLAAVSGIKHFRSRLEGRPFQLWTDHKPLIFALHRVSPPTSGHQQHHLDFISEYTNQLKYLPGMSNVVADALSRPAAAAAEVEWVCAAIADKSPLDLKDMALRQILFYRYKLSVPARGWASSLR
jgi:hypothetical protein